MGVPDPCGRPCVGFVTAVEVGGTTADDGAGAMIGAVGCGTTAADAVDGSTGAAEGEEVGEEAVGFGDR